MKISIGISIDIPCCNNEDVARSFNIGTAPTVVLASSGTGDEAQEIRPLDFFEYDDSTWGLLYAAKSSTTASTRTFKYATAAKSGFNHTWTKQGTVLSGGGGGAWDENLGGATLTKNGSTWILLYCSIAQGKIGVATGTSLGSLTKNGSNPVIDNTAATAFNKYLRHPIATIKDSTLYCHYEGRSASANQIINSKIGYATAPLTDLTDWTISSDVLIEPTDITYASGQNNAVANANIIKIGSYYYMWFQGYPAQDTGSEFEFGGTSYAYSTDLLNWTIVGTENYHVYMGLFGYNESNDFYHTCQEVTPVYDGSTLCLYMWDDRSSDIGKIDLDGGVFTNTFRGFTVADNFDDNSIDTGKWTTASGNGISVAETGSKMVVTCDGASDDSTFNVWLKSNYSLNSDDGVVVCCFNLERTTPVTGDFYGVELSNNDLGNDNVIRLGRDTTSGQIRIIIRENNVTITQNSYAYSGNETFKIIISKRNRYDVYRGDGANFEHIEGAVISGFENTDWTFRLKAVNSIGGGQTISLNDFAFGEYDSGKLATFQT